MVPRWVEVRGCVLRDDAYHPAAVEAEWRASGGNRRSIESTFNCVRLADEVADLDEEILGEVALLVAESWRATLRQAFPEREFDVVISSEGGPRVCATSHASGVQ
jgi:hypothetical protein